VHVKFIILVLAPFCYSLLMLGTMWWIRCPETSRNLFMTKTVCQRKDATTALLTCTHQGQGKATACAIETAYTRKGYLQYCRHPGPSSSLGAIHIPRDWGQTTASALQLGIGRTLSGENWDGRMPWAWTWWHLETSTHARVENRPSPLHCIHLSVVMGFRICYIQIETSGKLFCPYTW
jgi:hypothetical protein